MMVELKGVSKSFGSAGGVRKTDLNVPPGRTLVLIGPSGCGKSTLLRLMIGLIQPDTGSVHIAGTGMTPESAFSLRLRMGYVIQDGGLFPHLTARDNVALMPRYLGWDEDRIRRRLSELSDLTQFPAEGWDRFPVQLSGGQRQRVALMRAIVLDPEVILLDEPLGALDPMIRSDLQDDLRRIFRALKKTVILVTHDIGEAAFFGDTLVLLRDGMIVQQGPFEELLQAPADPFVTQFIKAQRTHLETLARGV